MASCEEGTSRIALYRKGGELCPPLGAQPRRTISTSPLTWARVIAMLPSTTQQRHMTLTEIRIALHQIMLDKPGAIYLTAGKIRVYSGPSREWMLVVHRHRKHEVPVIEWSRDKGFLLLHPYSGMWHDVATFVHTHTEEAA